MSDVIVYYEKLIIFKRNNKQFVPWNKSQKYNRLFFTRYFENKLILK